MTISSRPALTYHIGRWSMYLMGLLGALLVLSLAAGTYRAWRAYRHASYLGQVNQLAAALFNAADTAIHERALTRIEISQIGAGHSLPAQDDPALLAVTRRTADQRLQNALTNVAQVDPPGTTLAEQAQRINQVLLTLRPQVDHYLTSRAPGWNEGLLQGFTLTSIDLLDTLEQLMVRETQTLGATESQRTDRLVEINFNTWRLRKSISQLITSMQVQINRGHVMPQAEEILFETSRFNSTLAIEQIADSARQVHEPGLSAEVTKLKSGVDQVIQLGLDQTERTARHEPLLPLDNQILLVLQTIDHARAVHDMAQTLLAEQFDKQLRDYRSLFFLNLLFIALGILLTGGALLLLRSRVIKPLVRLQLILDAASDAIITLDERLNVHMLNKGTERLFETRLERARGRAIDTFLALTPEQREALRMLTREGGEYRGDSQALHHGKWIHVSMTGAPIQIGDSTGVLLIVRDVHARKAVEDSLSRSLKLIKTISRLQERIFTQGLRTEVYQELMQVLLDYTDSRYGFIGLIREPVAGRACVVLDDMVGGNEPSTCQCSVGEEEVPRVLELERLVEHPVTLREAVIFHSGAEQLALLENTLQLPRGSLDSFMLLPVVMKGLLVAMIGIGQRPGGYQARHAAELEPLSSAYASIVAYFHEEDAKHHSEQHLREVSQEQAAVFSTSPVGLMIVQDFRILRANTAAEDIFAGPEGGMLGCRINELLAHDNDSSHLIALLEQSVQEGQEGIELQCMRAGCVPFWASLHARPLDALHPERGFVLACIDMTEQKRTEAMLRRAKEEADAASRAKSAFLATMSHEIRTPMNGVIGMLELLSLSRLDDDQRDTLDTAQNSARSLLRLIDEILDFSKIEAGRLEIVPEAASLIEVMQKIRLLHAENASRKGLKLDLAIDPDVHPAVEVDEFRLSQILNNFVSNAIKFTLAGGVGLTLRLESRDEVQQTVAMTVADTGIGMSDESVQRLFEPFTQAESDTTRRFGGTGLGLAICKRLAERMGGRIDLRSQPGIGTMVTLTLTLPVIPVEALESQRKQEPVPAIALYPRTPSLPILFVEDNPINRKLIAKQLDLLGIPVVTAEDGSEALEKWHGGRFSLILTDCHMPRMDGYQLTRAVREAEQVAKLPRLPIIACTANASREEADQCLASGMDDFLSKPLTLDKLREMMNKWLTQKSEPEAGCEAASALESEMTQGLVSSPEIKAVSAVDAAQPLDRAQLEIYSDGDPGVELEILRDYWTTNSEDADALRKAGAAADYAAVSKWAHRIKGAARMIGAEPLGHVAQALEEAARQQDAAAMGMHLQALDKELGRLERYLTEQGVLPLPA